MTLDELLKIRPKAAFDATWNAAVFEALSRHENPHPLGKESFDALLTSTLNLYDAGCPILTAWENVLAVAFHVGLIGAVRANCELKEILKEMRQPTPELSRRSL